MITRHSYRLRCVAMVSALALGVGGCFAPALGLAPLALEASEAVGVGAIDVAGHAVGPKMDGAENVADTDERCDELMLEVPGTIELRVANNAPTAWRLLQLGGSTDAPQWQAVTGEPGDSAGWRPLQNLHTMSFVPPLQKSVRGNTPNYLAYAPAEPQTSVERDQLVAMTADFGTGLGTFQWQGRAYQYTLVNRLPCFPGPVVVAK